MFLTKHSGLHILKLLAAHQLKVAALDQSRNTYGTGTRIVHQYFPLLHVILANDQVRISILRFDRLLFEKST